MKYPLPKMVWITSAGIVTGLFFIFIGGCLEEGKHRNEDGTATRIGNSHN
jgi:hypothetical protein